MSYRLERWINQSAEERCKIYIFFTTVGSFVARAVEFGKIPFFSDKHNFLNQIFVKNCWAWTILLISLLAVVRMLFEKVPLRKIYLIILRLLFGTLYWYVCTSVIDGIKDNLGKCTTGAAETMLLCRAQGGVWKYVFDISGHMFMMVYCNLFITSHLEEMHGDEGPDSGSIPSRVISTLCLTLVSLFDIMMVFTVIYWHSPPEKILGCLIGVAGWTLTFKQLVKLLTK
eukprot:sb/3469545/